MTDPTSRGGPGIRRTKFPDRLSAAARAERLAAYRAGHTDPEIAALLGTTPGTIGQWRRSHGLPRNHSPFLSAEETARRGAAYNECPSDETAALRLGMTTQQFADWRHKQKLPTKSWPSRLNAEQRAAVIRIIQGSHSVPEAARKLGWSTGRLRAFRRRHGISWEPPGLTQDETRRREAAYQQTNSDVEAAERLNMAIQKFRRWRRKSGLAPKGDGQPHLSPDQQRHRMHVYETQPNDSAAARELGINRSVFMTWRWLNNLPPRNPGKPKLSPEEQKRRRTVYNECESDQEAASKLELKRFTFRQWRYAQGLPECSKETRAKAIAERKAAVALHGSLAAASVRLGISQEAMQRTAALHDFNTPFIEEARRQACRAEAAAGKSHQEIAVAVALPEKTVRRLLHNEPSPSRR